MPKPLLLIGSRTWMTLAVVTVQPALGGDPDEPLRVLDHCRHGVLGEAALAAQAREVEVACGRRCRRGRQCQRQYQSGKTDVPGDPDGEAG